MAEDPSDRTAPGEPRAIYGAWGPAGPRTIGLGLPRSPQRGRRGREGRRGEAIETAERRKRRTAPKEHSPPSLGAPRHKNGLSGRPLWLA